MKIKNFEPKPLNAKAAISRGYFGGFYIHTDFKFENEEFAKEALIFLLKHSPDYLKEYNLAELCKLDLDSDISEIPTFYGIKTIHDRYGDTIIFTKSEYELIYGGDFNLSDTFSFEETESIGDLKIGYIHWKK